MSSHASLPPPDFDSRQLTIHTITKLSPLYRVHQSAYGPIFFGPGAGKKPTYRFDSASGKFGVIYVAENQEAPLIETLLREPQQYTVSKRDIELRSMTVLTADRDINIAVCSGPSLSRMGATSAFFTGPYEVCGQWSDAIWAHPQNLDGILYPSRFNNQVECIALFDRHDLNLLVENTKTLNTIKHTVGAVLNQHGKGIL